MSALPIRKLLLLLLPLFVLGQPGFSQLCTGSLGDPVAVITFGEGSNPGLGSGTTAYTDASGCPKDGEYNITSLTFNCFSGTWHTVAGDHTPSDGGGFYLLANLTNTTGPLYAGTIDGLCAGSTYELSAWIINMLRPSATCASGAIEPSLTLTIQTPGGAELAKYNSGNFPRTELPEWKQFGTFFRLPAGVTSVQFSITSNSPGGCGNDIAMDDIAVRPCGPSISASLAINGESHMVVCGGDSRAFLLNSSYSSGYSNPVLQWQTSNDYGFSWTDIPGATGATYLRAATGEGYYYYRVTITEATNLGIIQCRITSAPVTFEVLKATGIVTCTNYVFGCYGSTIPLQAAGGISYKWTGPNGFTSDLQDPEIKNVRFEDAGEYRVIGTNQYGCPGTCSTNLVIYPAVVASISSDVLVCEGTPVQLNASGGTEYIWQPTDGLSNNYIANPVATPKDPTRYKVTIVKDGKCFDTASVYVDLWRKPIADAGRDRKMLLGLPIVLDGKASGTDVSFTWTPANFLQPGSSLRPSVNPPVDQAYYLEVKSNKGCGVARDTVLVKVFESILIPNTFTPNGDGYNDFWQIELMETFDEAVIEVYNTAGQLVHRSVGLYNPWDGTRNGKPLPIGTYYYGIDLKVENARRLSGYVTILR
jgi:gliding motility-associated-like protein